MSLSTTSLVKRSRVYFQESKPGYIGLINLGMGLRDICQRWISFVRELTEDKYGHCPEIKISGHIGAHFPYIEMPLDYILPELLKNAVRATIENNSNVRGVNLPTVHVILASNREDFIIKISDRSYLHLYFCASWGGIGSIHVPQ